MNRRRFITLGVGTPFLPLITFNAQTTEVSTSEGLVAALQAAHAGDTIVLREGYYIANTTYNQVPLRQACFKVDVPITLAAYSGERPVLTYISGNPPIVDTQDFGAILYLNAAGIILRGLTIIGTKFLGDSPGGADTDVAVLSSTGNVVIDQCQIFGFGHCGVKSYGGNVQIQNCTIGDGGFTFRDHGTYLFVGSDHNIQNTVFDGCAGYGVHLYGTPSRTTVNRCLISNCGNGGILLGGNGLHTISNNCILGCKGYGGLVLWKPESVNNNILNNLIRSNLMDVTLDYAVAPQNVRGNIYDTIQTNSDYSAWQQ